MRSRPILDLTKVRAAHIHHGIHVILTWYWHERVNDHRPCIVLADASRPLRQGATVAVIIPEKEAWRWALHDGVGDPMHCVQSADEWMGQGLLPGTPGNKMDRLRILNAIDSRLRDLVLMPPRPAGDTISLATAQVVDHESGRVIHEEEVTTDV